MPTLIRYTPKVRKQIFIEKSYPIKIQLFSHKPPFCSLVKFLRYIQNIFRVINQAYPPPFFPLIIILFKFWFLEFKDLYLKLKDHIFKFMNFLYYLMRVLWWYKLLLFKKEPHFFLLSIIYRIFFWTFWRTYLYLKSKFYE